MLPSSPKIEVWFVMNGLSPEERLNSLGIDLPDAPAPAGSYVRCVRSGGLIFVSGQLPLTDGKLVFEGRVGDELSVEQGKECARIAAVNSIAVLKAELGGLGGVRKIVKVTGYVASADGFTGQAEVLNGASDLYAYVFGDRGGHARAAVGAARLPLGAPVEIDLIAEADFG